MIGRLKCKLGLHKGYPEAKDGLMWFYCTRCEQHVHPTDTYPHDY